MERGQPIELRNEYTGQWSSGFEVADIVERRQHDRAVTEYRVKRSSDGSVIPALFPARRVRPSDRF